MLVYLAALVALLHACGIPVLVAAGIVFVVWSIYATRRK